MIILLTRITGESTMNQINLIRIALSVITDRIITILSLIMSCGLASYAMYSPTWDRVAILGIFVLFAYLVIRIKEKASERSNSDQEV